MTTTNKIGIVFNGTESTIVSFGDGNQCGLASTTAQGLTELDEIVEAFVMEADANDQPIEIVEIDMNHCKIRELYPA